MRRASPRRRGGNGARRIGSSDQRGRSCTSNDVFVHSLSCCWSRPWPCSDSRGPWRRPARRAPRRRPTRPTPARSSTRSAGPGSRTTSTRSSASSRRRSRCGTSPTTRSSATTPRRSRRRRARTSTGLATDWTVSDDGLTWTFTIRKNAKWDDGVPLTAKDVAFTYNFIIDNPDQTSNLTAYTNLIDKATAVDDYHGGVRVLQAQAGHDPPLGAHPARAHLVQDPGQGRGEEVPEHPAVRGLRPLQVRRVEEEQLRASSSPTPLGGARKPKIDELYFTYYTNGDTMLQDIKAGTIDGAVRPASRRRSSSSRASPDITARAIATDALRRAGLQLLHTGPARATRCCGTSSSGRR